MFAAVINSIAVLYAAVAIHLTIIAGENTIGRHYSNEPNESALAQGSASQAPLFVWAICHAVALSAAIALIARSRLTAHQIFALGAIFGYSINLFSIVVGHELLHRRATAPQICADILFAMMLLPQFPTVHLASHHRWAGTTQDCQTPHAGEQIYPYLWRALYEGLCLSLSRSARAHEPYLLRRTAITLALIALGSIYGWPVLLFLVVQGVFAFLVLETLNYVQHYAVERPVPGIAQAANRDINFVSRCILMNLPLHDAHHTHPSLSYSELTRVPDAQTYCWGYWTSFWIVWLPPLWQHLQRQRVRQVVER
ncbi:MAG: fatty acid desaturase [Proteobacteria bacterium]|nr:fatty acid desaturase [Pseudomonadota bacterium]